MRVPIIKAALLAVVLLLSLVPSVSAVKVHEPHPRHWNTGSQAGLGRCPDGLTVRLGGGGGWRTVMQKAIDRWNSDVAPAYAAAPYITRVEHVEWNTAVSYFPCTIDTDEVYDEPGEGWSNYYYHGDDHHFGGAVIKFQTTAWFSFNDFERKFIAFHELGHVMGLGHQLDSFTSAMSYRFSCICHNAEDVRTLTGLYGHRNVHADVW